jgi:hypothetical protein
MAVTLPIPSAPTRAPADLRNDFGMAIERHGHRDDGRPEEEMHELRAVEIPFV